MAKKKNIYCDKWDLSILEQVASSCNIAARAQTDEDWRLFLQGVYDGIKLLDNDQRVILLLSQEFSLALVDIARIMNKPISTVVVTLQAAIDKLVLFLKSRSLTRRDLFESRAIQMIYTETLNLEELNNGPADFEFLDQYESPWFYSVNYLFKALK